MESPGQWQNNGDNRQLEKAKLYYLWPVKKVEKFGENLYKVVLEI